MSIHLGRGIYTREPVADFRLRRIVQVSEDLLGKPLSEARVLDLACLEGHYAIEFALHGAEVVGLEIREANLAKARYAQQELGLDNIRFIQDDVRNLSQRQHGSFDIVICSGILYHLDVPDVFDFVQRIYDVSTRLVVFDTQISLSDRASVEYRGQTYSGLWYQEHDDRADKATKYRDYWASIDNTRSFWLSHASLCNLMSDVGFSSLLRVESPNMPRLAADRATYVAVRGSRAKVLSSPPTDALVEERRPEHDDAQPNPVQQARGPVFRVLKATLPQPVKDVIKQGLRAVHLMPPDSTPSFLRDKGEGS
jgi:ubiquinone/menaquinone biosynthesis C-methylase UbiE